MKLYCPHCGVKGFADDSYRGKKVKCPKCLETFVAEENAAEKKERDQWPAAVVTEDSISPESPADLRNEEDLPDAAAPAEVTPAEELEGADEVEAADKAEVVEPEPAVIPPADDARPGEEKEAVLDWDEIAAEIEAKTAADDQFETKEQEELPAGLFADATEEEHVPPMAEETAVDTAEPEIAEKVESRDETEDLPDREEVPPAGIVVEQPAAPAAEAGKAEEGRENHFIFEEQGRETEPAEEVLNQPYGFIKEQCWQCGKKNRTEVPFIARGGRLYCPACQPVAEPEAPSFADASTPPGAPAPMEEAFVDQPLVTESRKAGFAVGAVLREAWEQTKGAKGTIWAGSAVMYLTILVLAAGTTFLLPGFGQEVSVETDMATEIAKYALQALTDAVSVLFTAGLLFMGIRKVAGDPIFWKMIFTGFSDAGKIIVATILQSLLIVIGFMILVLPGIYLAIAYSMTIPLIVDRKMSPWQAMETSRKAVHQVWWRVVGLYLVMGCIFLVSMVPLGIGLIWTWPMFVILAGVVYHHLFGSEK